MVFFEECNVDGHKPVAVGWLNHTRDWDACNESKSLLIFGSVRVPVSESSLLIAQILQGLCLSLWYQPWWDQGLAFIQFHMFNPKNALNSAPQRVPTHTQIFERTCSENWGQSCDQVFMHEFMHKILVGFKIYEDYFAVAPENSNQNWCPDILHTLCDVSLSLSHTRFHLWDQFTEEITGAFLHQPCFPDPKCNSERVGTLRTGQISEGLTISWRSKSWGLWKVRTFFQYKIWKHLLLIALRLRHWIRGSPVHV